MEKGSIAPLEKYLFWYPSREHPEVSPGITAWEVVAASYLQVSLLHERRPDEFWVSPIDHEESTRRL